MYPLLEVVHTQGHTKQKRIVQAKSIELVDGRTVTRNQVANFRIKATEAGDENVASFWGEVLADWPAEEISARVKYVRLANGRMVTEPQAVKMMNDAVAKGNRKAASYWKSILDRFGGGDADTDDMDDLFREAGVR